MITKNITIMLIVDEELEICFTPMLEIAFDCQVMTCSDPSVVLARTNDILPDVILQETYYERNNDLKITTKLIEANYDPAKLFVIGPIVEEGEKEHLLELLSDTNILESPFSSDQLITAVSNATGIAPKS